MDYTSTFLTSTAECFLAIGIFLGGPIAWVLLDEAIHRWIDKRRSRRNRNFT